MAALPPLLRPLYPPCRPAQLTRRGGHALDGSRSGRGFHAMARRRIPELRAAGGASDSSFSPGDSFWETEEGRGRMREVEDMRQLLSHADRLQAGMEEGAPALQASQEGEEGGSPLRGELEKLARDQAEKRKEAEKMFHIGQRAYGKGMYEKSVEFLEAALTNIPGITNLGGEIQIWLAMAYEAHNRHSDCILLYKRLEKSHPNKSIRRQAKDLRYILEAPKLKISKDEMVTIPLLNQYSDSDSWTWSRMYRERRRKNIAKKIPQSRDYLADWLVWNPPRWEKSPYFWVAVTVWLTLAGVSLMFQN